MNRQPSIVLDQLVASGREPGAAVGVVRDGIVEVDHCGGTPARDPRWTTDTLVMTFSVATPRAALAFLHAIRQGAVGLDQPVASSTRCFRRAART